MATINNQFKQAVRQLPGRTPGKRLSYKLRASLRPLPRPPGITLQGGMVPCYRYMAWPKYTTYWQNK